MGQIEKKQYHLLNAVKIIAAFSVVCIHVPFPGVFGRGVIAVSRFAVPFFFMAAGFFSYYEKKEVLNEKYKRKIRHLLTLFVWSFLLYFVYDLLGNLTKGTLTVYLKEMFAPGAFAELLIFNHVRVKEALWFLPALVYVYLLFFIFEKAGITKKMYVLIPVLFGAGVILREIPAFAGQVPAVMNEPFFCRNFLFVGLPFFMLGHFVRANEDACKEKFSDGALAAVILVATAEAVGADLLHVQKSVYIGTLFAVFALFVFAVKKEDKIRVPRLASLGASYSLYVYLFHIFVKNVLRKAGEVIPALGSFLDLLSPVMPIVVFALTLALSIVFVFVLKKGKALISKKGKQNS